MPRRRRHVHLSHQSEAGWRGSPGITSPPPTHEMIADVPTDRGMTHLWTTVYAVLPDGWEFRGVVKGPRQGDPLIRSPDWVAGLVAPASRTV
jgi:hypothetical protein